MKPYTYLHEARQYLHETIQIFTWVFVIFTLNQVSIYMKLDSYYIKPIYIINKNLCICFSASRFKKAYREFDRQRLHGTRQR